MRSIVKRKSICPGGGAAEIEVAVRMQELSNKVKGLKAYCYRGFAEAMEIIPYTLAENAGLNPINIVTELRNRHISGDKHDGINVKKVLLLNKV